VRAAVRVLAVSTNFGLAIRSLVEASVEDAYYLHGPYLRRCQNLALLHQLVDHCAAIVLIDPQAPVTAVSSGAQDPRAIAAPLVPRKAAMTPAT